MLELQMLNTKRNKRSQVLYSRSLLFIKPHAHTVRSGRLLYQVFERIQLQRTQNSNEGPLLYAESYKFQVTRVDSFRINL